MEIHDADVATAFAIEALLLVDHYNFLDRYAKAKKSKLTAARTKRWNCDNGGKERRKQESSEEGPT